MINVHVIETKSELNLIINHIRELKHRRSQSGQPNWTVGDMRELDILKDQATCYCMILAQRHHKVHLKGKTLEEQEIELGKLWSRNSIVWRKYYVFEAPVIVSAA